MPESRAEKKERLTKEAKAKIDNKQAESKKPYCLKYGLNHITSLIE